MIEKFELEFELKKKKQSKKSNIVSYRTDARNVVRKKSFGNKTIIIYVRIGIVLSFAYAKSESLQTYPNIV